MFNFNKTLSFPFFPIGKLKNKPNENNTMMFLHHTYIKHHILFHYEIKTKRTTFFMFPHQNNSENRFSFFLTPFFTPLFFHFQKQKVE